jgi:DNA-binding transcriptional LysR family regulator
MDMLHEIDLGRADLNLLVLFEVVLRERHVGRAADRLHLSPSAVSHGLGRLRRLLGDPLFLRTPKGVVPTARASELAQPIAEILARTRSVIGSAEPFDPARSRRRFVVGAPDGVPAVFLPALLATLRRTAPGIDIGVRQVLQTAFAELDSRSIDIAVVPIDDIPARFVHRVLYEEDFVVAARRGHPFLAAPTLDRYCKMQHLVVSFAGDAHGFVDEALAGRGRSRRVALTVPSFMQALALVGETDLLAAAARRLVATHGVRFGVVACEPPVPLMRSRIRAIVPKVAMMDAGVAWLLDRLEDSMRGDDHAARGSRPARRRGARDR